MIGFCDVVLGRGCDCFRNPIITFDAQRPCLTVGQSSELGASDDNIMILSGKLMGLGGFGVGLGRRGSRPIRDVGWIYFVIVSLCFTRSSLRLAHRFPRAGNR